MSFPGFENIETDWRKRVSMKKLQTPHDALETHEPSPDVVYQKREIATQAKHTASKRHKYGAVATERDGIRFDSKLEADRYRELTLLRASGEVSYFLRQTPIHLPGGTKLVIDFLVFWRNGSVTYEDTKGRLTPAFRIKRREVEYLYPFKITILKRADVSRFDF